MEGYVRGHGGTAYRRHRLGNRSALFSHESGSSLFELVRILFSFFHHASILSVKTEALKVSYLALYFLGEDSLRTKPFLRASLSRAGGDEMEGYVRGPGGNA